jgi:hypothetical protein
MKASVCIDGRKEWFKYLQSGECEFRAGEDLTDLEVDFPLRFDLLLDLFLLDFLLDFDFDLGVSFIDYFLDFLTEENPQSHSLFSKIWTALAWGIFVTLYYLDAPVLYGLLSIQ